MNRKLALAAATVIGLSAIPLAQSPALAAAAPSCMYKSSSRSEVFYEYVTIQNSCAIGYSTKVIVNNASDPCAYIAAGARKEFGFPKSGSYAGIEVLSRC